MTPTFPVRVERIRREAVDVLLFRLVRPDGGPLPAFTPGSHVDVHLGPGLTRQYSLCSAPSDRLGYAIAVKQEASSRGGSAALHGGIREGGLLTISEPRNNFGLDENAKESLLIAAGIGVTPMISMALHPNDQGAPFGLHYFARSAEHTAFRDLLAEPECAVRVHVQHGLELGAAH